MSQDFAALDALSPLKVLARGYSVAEVDGHPITSVKSVAVGDEINLRVNDGTLLCEIKEKGELYE